jgi:hypothetical protein
MEASQKRAGAFIIWIWPNILDARVGDEVGPSVQNLVIISIS